MQVVLKTNNHVDFINVYTKEIATDYADLRLLAGSAGGGWKFCYLVFAGGYPSTVMYCNINNCNRWHSYRFWRFNN